MPARVVPPVFFDFPAWPYYITGVDVWVTVNTDRSVPETNYENNTKHVYLWEYDCNAFTFHSWPTRSRFPEDIFVLAWRNTGSVECDGCLAVITQAEIRDAIARGIVTYLPAVNGDMLKLPIKLAVARHCAEPTSTTLFLRYITYNGPRTVEGNIQFDEQSNVKVINPYILLKIQRENFLEVWLGNGRRYRLNIRLDGLPWNLN